MSQFERTLAGVRVPAFLYGTAWKEQATAGLVRQALEAGFRGIDTANQRRHYHEVGVGEALAQAYADGLVQRADLFLQSKFTHRGGQDHRLPYDERAPVAEQVEQSFASSLEHLGCERLDALVLHGPSQRRGLAPEDVEAWQAMERIHARGEARLLGVSNVTRDQLAEVCALAAAKPAFVQNRCYARLGWDRATRELCREEGIVYQGFSLLTANRAELAHPDLLAVAQRTGATPEQVVFRFALQVGMLPLTGTTDPAHMREDLAAADGFELTDAEVARLEAISG